MDEDVDVDVDVGVDVGVEENYVMRGHSPALWILRFISCAHR